MALRLVEVAFGRGREPDPQQFLERLRKAPVVDAWETGAFGDRVGFRALVDGRDAESLVDDLAARSRTDDGYRVVLLPVEATVPSPLFFIQVVLSTLVAAVGLLAMIRP